MHLSATIRAGEESSQARIAGELRERLDAGGVSALPDGRTVILSSAYDDETSCMRHVDAEIMPMFKMVRRASWPNGPGPPRPGVPMMAIVPDPARP